jgi:hypothetical protein
VKTKSITVPESDVLPWCLANCLALNRNVVKSATLIMLSLSSLASLSLSISSSSSSSGVPLRMSTALKLYGIDRRWKKYKWKW